MNFDDLAFWPYKSKREMEMAKQGKAPQRRMDGSLVSNHAPISEDMKRKVEQLRRLMGESEK